MRVIGIISGKGGVGKTTTSVNLGGALNYFGEDVTVVDANFTAPDISVLLGFPKLGLNLKSVLSGKCGVNDALYAHSSGTKLLPTSLSLAELNIDGSNLSNVVRRLDSEIVLVDSCAGFEKDFFHVLNAVDEVLIVCNSDLLSATNALKAVNLAKQYGKKVLGLVLNRYDGTGMSAKAIENLIGVNVIGLVPEDQYIKKALDEKDMVVYLEPEADASIAFKKLAADLIGRDYKIPEVKNSRLGDFLRFIGL